MRTSYLVAALVALVTLTAAPAKASEDLLVCPAREVQDAGGFDLPSGCLQRHWLAQPDPIVTCGAGTEEWICPTDDADRVPFDPCGAAMPGPLSLWSSWCCPG